METINETVACGNEFSLFIDINQDVWSCGRNSDQQLGRQTYRFRPQKIPDLQGVVGVTGGDIFTACLDSSGVVHVMGGLQGIVRPTDDPLSYRTKIGVEHLAKSGEVPAFKYINGHLFPQLLLVDVEGNAWSCGGQERAPLKKYSNLPEIVSGGNCYYLLDKDGCVWTGASHFSQVPNLPRIKQICGVQNQTYYLDYEGNVYRESQRLELGDVSMTHIACGPSHLIMTDTEGRVWGKGTNSYGQLAGNRGESIQIIHNGGVVMAACGSMHTLLLDGDGSVWASGNNQYGQLGIGESSPQYAFIKVQRIPEIVSPFYRTSTKSARK